MPPTSLSPAPVQERASSSAATPSLAPSPLLTVVTVWDGAPEPLATWLASLSAQTLPASFVELLVVTTGAGESALLPALDVEVLRVAASAGQVGGRVRAMARGRWMLSVALDAPLPPTFLADRLQALIAGACVEREAVSLVQLDYPVVPIPRWGWGRPAHPQLSALLERGRAGYGEIVDAVVERAEALAALPWHEDADDLAAPAWHNAWFSGLDAAALYTLLQTRAPRRVLEVGSGHSTRFARRAIADAGLETRLMSIDPHPRATIDALCDEVVRAPVEDVDLAVFDVLEAGDVLFVDNSHQVMMNSDATTIFMDVLPRLKPGVLVHIHDVFLPWDYPPQWADHFYGEHYVLAGMLMGGGRYETVFPVHFVHHDPDLAARLEPLWSRSPFCDHPGMSRGGGSYWLQVCA